MDIMNDRLHRGSTAGLSAKETLFLCFVFIILEHHGEGQEDKWSHNAKDAVAPAPAVFSINRVCGQGAREGSTDERGLHKSKGERSVPETRRIGHEHIQDEVQAVVPDPVERVSRGITTGPIARSENNHAE